MELVFITKAIRRYWWMVVIGTVVGLLAGALAAPADGDTYESEALIQVAPVTEFGSAATSTDRYVQNQLTLLDSIALAQQVADDVGESSAAVVRSSTAVEQVDGTDIVRIYVRAGDPALSQDIANGYVDAYQESVRRQSLDAREPDIMSLQSSLSGLREQLTTVDAQIQAELAPFLPGGASANPLVVPGIEDVNPALATERTVLLEEYSELLIARNQMEFGTSQQRTGTQVLQRAELPTAPTDGGLALLLIAGPVIGAVLGAFAAVAWARVSRRVLDVDEIGDVLGAPVVGAIPAVRGVGDFQQLVRAGPPEAIVPAIQQLCVQAEAAGGSTEGPLTVVVATASRGAGGTSTAALLARRYAENGTKVLLMDADSSDPALSRAFGGAARGIRSLIDAEVRGDTRRAATARSIRPYSETGYPNLRFAGLDETAEGRSLRRQDAPALLVAAGHHAQIVVVDVGPLMSAAASVHLAELCDALVLVVPEKRQDRGELELVGRQLKTMGTIALPVSTDIGVSWMSLSRRRSAAEADDREVPPPAREDPVDPVSAESVTH